MASKVLERCDWVDNNPLMIEYHDKEWGVPEHNDKMLFEFLILEGAQAGLNWQTILNKREGYRKAFSGFDASKIAGYGDKDVARLLSDSGIIRNHLKIAATIKNARAFLAVQKEFGSFNSWIWQFVGGKPIKNHFVWLDEIPSKTEQSITMSKALLKRTFGFVGPTTCYAFMEAVGMVNDHQTKCFRYNQP